MEITVLCKVVDNFGDIGVVWRMCRQIKKISADANLNLLVDDLISFNKICSSVNIDKSEQIVEGINIYYWKDYDYCYKKFSEKDGEKLNIILECFQCGRPDWMEKILFEDKLERTVNIIMIDYLTAEDYAETFHCLKSLTRSAKVQKVNFMPGFTNKTGGLIIDEEWENIPERNKTGDILVFTYERDWTPLAKSLEKHIHESEKKVLLARGRGFDSFKEAWLKNVNGNTGLVELEFLDLPEWDNLMKSCSVLIIRGEESMSRACLSGIPFIWHAYPQSDEYQLVKVEALLNKLKPFMNESQYKIVDKVWHLINSPEKEVNPMEFEAALDDFMRNSDSLALSYFNFAKSIQKNGDLVHNLMTFIDKNIIMN